MTGAELNLTNARDECERFISTISPYPGASTGRGIVICAGGLQYFTSAWVCINLLRRNGCTLPIQMWHLGPEELDERMRDIVRPLGVECVDAYEMRREHPARILRGWEVKPYSIIHSPYREVILLDADNMPLIDPTELFDTSEYKVTGALFWPDLGRLKSDRSIWEICGVQYQDEAEFESGQIVLNKESCWDALALTMWFNEHSDFYYQHIHGDKETFHMAFRKLNQPYSMTPHAPSVYGGKQIQHDFQGRCIFQHQNKWRLYGDNKDVAGVGLLNEGRKLIEELRGLWNGIILPPRQRGCKE